MVKTMGKIKQVRVDLLPISIFFEFSRNGDHTDPTPLFQS